MTDKNVNSAQNLKADTAKADGMLQVRRSQLTITDIAQPFSSLIRVRGIVDNGDEDHWLRPNNAVRIEMDAIGSVKPITRVYTIRDYDETNHSVEIDFVVHHGESLAMEWLRQQKIGDTIYMLGPKQHYMPDCNNNNETLFFADDTAIPALFSILKTWPQDKYARVFIDCAEKAAADELPKGKNITYNVFQRDHQTPAGSAHFLTNQALLIDNTKPANLWVACEREEARRIREHFLNAGYFSKADMKVVGYWKHGLTSSLVDEKRMAYYIDMKQQGKNLQHLDEFDIKI